MPKKGNVTALLLVLLLVGLSSARCTLSDTPRRSLSELRTALLNHDADTAMRYIDVDSVVNGMVRDIFLKYEAKADDPFAILGLKVGKEVAAAVLPSVKAVARWQVRSAITSDDQWGYFDDIRKASVWYLRIRVDGDTAIVEPRGKPATGFKMERTGDGHWKIVEIIHEKGLGLPSSGTY
jgi:hypothetical protein